MAEGAESLSKIPGSADLAAFKEAEQLRNIENLKDSLSPIAGTPAEIKLSCERWRAAALMQRGEMSRLREEVTFLSSRLSEIQSKVMMFQQDQTFNDAKLQVVVEEKLREVNQLTTLTQSLQRENSQLKYVMNSGNHDQLLAQSPTSLNSFPPPPPLSPSPTSYQTPSPVFLSAISQLNEALQSLSISVASTPSLRTTSNAVHVASERISERVLPAIHNLLSNLQDIDPLASSLLSLGRSVGNAAVTLNDTISYLVSKAERGVHAEGSQRSDQETIRVLKEQLDAVTSRHQALLESSVQLIQRSNDNIMSRSPTFTRPSTPSDEELKVLMLSILKNQNKQDSNNFNSHVKTHPDNYINTHILNGNTEQKEEAPVSHSHPLIPSKVVAFSNGMSQPVQNSSETLVLKKEHSTFDQDPILKHNSNRSTYNNSSMIHFEEDFHESEYSLSYEKQAELSNWIMRESAIVAHTAAQVPVDRGHNSPLKKHSISPLEGDIPAILNRVHFEELENDFQFESKKASQVSADNFSNKGDENVSAMNIHQMIQENKRTTTIEDMLPNEPIVDMHPIFSYQGRTTLSRADPAIAALYDLKSIDAVQPVRTDNRLISTTAASSQNPPRFTSPLNQPSVSNVTHTNINADINNNHVPLSGATLQNNFRVAPSPPPPPGISNFPSDFVGPTSIKSELSVVSNQVNRLDNQALLAPSSNKTAVENKTDSRTINNMSLINHNTHTNTVKQMASSPTILSQDEIRIPYKDPLQSEEIVENRPPRVASSSLPQIDKNPLGTKPKVPTNAIGDFTVTTTPSQNISMNTSFNNNNNNNQKSSFPTDSLNHHSSEGVNAVSLPSKNNNFESQNKFGQQEQPTMSVYPCASSENMIILNHPFKVIPSSSTGSERNLRRNSSGLLIKRGTTGRTFASSPSSNADVTLLAPSFSMSSSISTLDSLVSHSVTVPPLTILKHTNHENETRLQSFSDNPVSIENDAHSFSTIRRAISTSISSETTNKKNILRPPPVFKSSMRTHQNSFMNSSLSMSSQKVQVPAFVTNDFEGDNININTINSTGMSTQDDEYSEKRIANDYNHDHSNWFESFDDMMKSFTCEKSRKSNYSF